MFATIVLSIKLNKRVQSNNTNFQASIKILVKIDTVSTRKSDPFVKVGKN